MKNQLHVAIVVVTYNRADVTCLMLDSLVKAQNQLTKFDLFLVDNHSSDEELLQIRNHFVNLKNLNKLTGQFIANKENKGFSGGNNIGIKMAFSANIYSHICLLNNDTLVTDYWLDRLVSHKVNGLIGPISNSVGNEQIVPLFYEIKGVSNQTLDHVFQFGEKWHETHAGQLVNTNMLGFFCVLGPTSVFEKIGLLDEAYGIGTFEDDDYCVRARQLEFEIKIARDVFVHHWGSASFSRLKRDSFMKLTAKNRAYYEHKHQIIWPTYSTTLVDALCLEAEWRNLHPSDLSEKTYQNYQSMLKGYIKSIYLQVENIHSLSFLGLISWSLKNNVNMNKYLRVLLLMTTQLLQGFCGEKSAFSEFRELLKKVLIWVKNQYMARL